MALAAVAWLTLIAPDAEAVAPDRPRSTPARTLTITRPALFFCWDGAAWVPSAASCCFVRDGGAFWCAPPSLHAGSTAAMARTRAAEPAEIPQARPFDIE